MKKILFSAIAMIAFTGASLANTEEVKTIVKPEANTEKAAEGEKTNCSTYASQQVAQDEELGGCLSTTEYNWAYTCYYNGCLKGHILN